jgi:hypothetical protein
LLNFKDSERESIASYFEKDLLANMIDTPTRLINESNEFLPKKQIKFSKERKRSTDCNKAEIVDYQSID